MTTLSGTCPHDANPGPHTVQTDHPDPSLANRMPVVCVGCGFEFVIDGGSTYPTSATLATFTRAPGPGLDG